MSEQVTPVKKLIKAVERILSSYADQLNNMAEWKEVENPIDDKTIDTVIKIVKEMNNFENFDKIANPFLKEEEKPKRTPIEEVSEKIKKNGAQAR